MNFILQNPSKEDVVRDVSLREQINLVEAAIKQHPLANQVDLKYNHIFSDGIYARELFIPKGTILVGKIHKFHNLNFMTKGKMEVSVGDKIKIIEAPFYVVSPPNTKRIARALEDTIWITVLRTDETDISKIEEAFTCNSDEEYKKFLEQQPQLSLDFKC